jgi:hypothetical protein
MFEYIKLAMLPLSSSTAYTLINRLSNKSKAAVACLYVACSLGIVFLGGV